MPDISLSLSREPLDQVSEKVLGAAAIEKEGILRGGECSNKNSSQLFGLCSQDGSIFHPNPSPLLL